MKKLLLFACITGASFSSISQVNWQKGGNSTAGGANSSLGTNGTWNAPLFFQTFGVNRTKLNGNLTAGGPTAQYAIDSYGWGSGVNTSGYFLLGGNGPLFQNAPANQSLYNAMGAFSLLHLNGGNNQIVQQFGYRPWMRTGITFTDNSDLSYMGIRQVGSGTDVTETTIAWADNGAGPFPGPDDMVFRFLNNGSGDNVINTNLQTGNDLDGLHVARFAGTGEFGLGNTFGSNPVGTPANLYVRPQSLFHMSYQYRTGAANEPFGFMQITYRRANGTTTDIIGQGEQATDGLRLGIDNDVFGTPAALNHLNG